ncbi:MAG: hypothetical protein C4291_01205 [Candidatus Dadabacteria bacterium]
MYYVKASLPTYNNGLSFLVYLHSDRHLSCALHQQKSKLATEIEGIMGDKLVNMGSGNCGNTNNANIFTCILNDFDFDRLWPVSPLDNTPFIKIFHFSPTTLEL